VRNEPERHEGPPVRIIDVSADRLPEVLEVVRFGFATVADEFGLTVENAPTNAGFWTLPEIQRVVARPTQVFAVEQSGRLVGCGFACAARNRPGTWELRHLAVLPEARHRGYGEALVAEAARRSREAGAATLRIGIIAENRRLSAWYVRLGFVTVEAGSRYPGLPFTVDHLELAL
jgi:ribosomal protein S18 acetylase RimI-like enzyme